jgi:hypothetical protein
VLLVRRRVGVFCRRIPASKFRDSRALEAPMSPWDRRGALGGPQAMPAVSLLDRSFLSIQRVLTPSLGAMSHVPTTQLRRPLSADFRGESEGENDSRT